MNAQQTITAIENGKFNEIFTTLYGEENIPAQKVRYTNTVNEFAKLFGADREISLFSVAGRSEISGNHTDHNYGKVLAASINLDIIAAASPRGDMHINIKSEGFPIDEVDITDPTVDENLYYTSKSIISGMCSGFLKYGHKVGGYDAYTTSNVFKGSGLSSSAAFEDMVGLILNGFYNDGKVENASRYSSLSRPSASWSCLSLSDLMIPVSAKTSSCGSKTISSKQRNGILPFESCRSARFLAVLYRYARNAPSPEIFLSFAKSLAKDSIIMSSAS